MKKTALGMIMGSLSLALALAAVANPPATGAVRSRVPVLEDNGYFPCTSCHDDDDPEVDTSRRALEAEHTELKVTHGQGRLWCFDCHDANKRDRLHTLDGNLVDIGDPTPLCAQCHAAVARDVAGGAHGKRVNGWKGPAEILACTACHRAHAPKTTPRPPLPLVDTAATKRPSPTRAPWFFERTLVERKVVEEVAP